MRGHNDLCDRALEKTNTELRICHQIHSKYSLARNDQSFADARSRLRHEDVRFRNCSDREFFHIHPGPRHGVLSTSALLHIRDSSRRELKI